MKYMSIMKLLRDNIKVIFIVVIVGFVISIFAGLGSYFFSFQGNALDINGEKIKTDYFNKYCDNLYYQFSLESSEKKQQAPSKKEIKNIAIRDIVQSNLILQEANKLGEVVSDAEVQGLIINYPIFQNNGKFDSNLYYRNLRYVIKKTPEQFEEEILYKIKEEKIKFLIMNSIKVSKNELFFANIKNENSVDFYNNYYSSKKSMILNSWFSNIVSKSKIKILLKE